MKKLIVFVVVVVALFSGVVWYLSDVPGTPGTTTPPLTSDEEDAADQLKAHVVALSRDVGSRSNSDPSRLATALEYIESSLRRTGLELKRQNFEANGRAVSMIFAESKGTSKPNEIVVVGTHYDTPRGSPGADDNASGVAVAIELAKRVAVTGSERTMRFAFFGLSEAPFAGTDAQGAHQYAKACLEKKEKVVAAVMLEGLGFFSDKPGSQSTPFPFMFSYPDRGDFVAFLADTSSRDLLQQTIGAFRATRRLPSQGCTLPFFYPGFGGSDAVAFSQAGVPAVLVTDTGSLRNPEYGKPTDTHDRLDYARMARVLGGLASVVGGLGRGLGART